MQMALLRSKTEAGILIPTSKQAKEWRGYVIGVGEGLKGVEFGDLVALRRWGDEASTFLRNPLKDIAGWWGNAPAKYWGDWTGSGRMVEVELAELLLIGTPDMILYRINTLKSVIRGDHPRIDPLFDRVLIKNAGRREKSDGGVQLLADWFRNPNPVGQIVGQSHENFDLGEWVMVFPNRGTLVGYGKHELTLCKAEDVALRFGATPPNRALWPKAPFQQVA